jgi:hypothetical protein
MPDSAVVDVAIGLAVIFATFSVAVSRVNETVLGLLNYRGRQLEAELRRLVGDLPGTAGGDDLTTRLLDGPLRHLRSGVSGATPNMTTIPPVAGRMASARRARRLRLPAYIPSFSFAHAVLDCIDPPARGLLHQIDPSRLPAGARDAYRAAYRELTPTTAEALRAAVARTTTRTSADESMRELVARIVRLTPNAAVGPVEEEIMRLLPDRSPLRWALTSITVRASGDRNIAAAELAQWYDQAMDRLSGWYKRQIQRFLLGYAIVVTIAFNLDTIAMTEALWQNGTLRAAVVAAAQDRVSAPTAAADSPAGTSDGTSTDSSGSAVHDLIGDIRELAALHLPFGWDASADGDNPRAVPQTVGGWALKVFGWTVTALTLSLGAPFWFDLLGRVVNMRDTGPRPEPADPQGPAR